MPSIFRPDFEYSDGDPPGFVTGRARVGAAAGAHQLGAAVYTIPPGEAICPYHWHGIEEEMLIVLDGTAAVRGPAGWRDAGPGEVVAFPAGEEGAHQVANRSDAEIRVLLLSTIAEMEACGYPDSDKLSIRGRGRRRSMFRAGDVVDYWDGETRPELGR